MTVSELIKKLKKFNKDTEVMVAMGESFGYGFTIDSNDDAVFFLIPEEEVAKDIALALSVDAALEMKA